MALLIDGYNVLYAVGILGGRVGPGTLERARSALVNFLAASLPPEEVPQTTVVFDAADAPRDLPHGYQHRGLHIRFAVGYENADALLAELIRTESTPRRLTVVSSDRQVQRAARRRHAKAIDAESWWSETERRRGRRRKPLHKAAPTPKTAGPLSEEEVAFWLEEFSRSSPNEPTSAEQGEGPAGGVPPQSPAVESPASEKPIDLENPFPPGYGEDLLGEDE